MRPRYFRTRCNGGVSVYLRGQEIVSFPQSIHSELNTLTINSALLSDNLISFYQHIL